MPGAEYVRVCICGCRRELLNKDGEPDLERFFFNEECRRRDKIARIDQQRRRKEAKSDRRKTCPTCKRTKKRFYLTVMRPDGKFVKVGVLNQKTADKVIAAAAMPSPGVRPPAAVSTPIKKRRARA